MRCLALLVPAALMLGASPALADETYVESTAGVIWNHEDTNAVVSGAIGHDVDLNEHVFIGVEGLAEKTLAADTRVVWGVGGRMGARLVPGGKFYVAANWQTKDCRACSDAVGLSTGWEQDLNERVYAKVEYKHVLIGDGEPDADIAAVGLGYKF